MIDVTALVDRLTVALLTSDTGWTRDVLGCAVRTREYVAELIGEITEAARDDGYAAGWGDGADAMRGACIERLTSKAPDLFADLTVAP